MKKDYYANTRKKKTVLAILIWQNLNIKIEALLEIRELFHKERLSTNQKYIQILTV